MANITYYNGNEGVYFLRDVFSYEITSVSSTEIVMQYNASELGTFDSGRHAWEYRLTVVNPETDTPDDPNAPPMAVDFTGGTLTQIQAFNMAGDLVWDMSGLNSSLSLLSNFANDNQGFNASSYIYAGTHTITGASDSAAPYDWNGDAIRTGWGDDLVEAGRGDDFIEDRGGSDTYKGGKGSDTVSYSSAYYDPAFAFQGVVADLAAGTATGADGEVDTLISIERLRGSFLADTLLGDEDNNTFNGMQGDDTINGRDGFDVLDYRRDADQGGRFGVRADLSEDRVRDGFHDDDTVTNVEGIRGTEFRDKMRDNKQDNYFEGRGGNDLLRVAKGNDTLDGGAGEDRFVFLGNKFAHDIVLDFEDGIDEIKIDNAASFAELTIVDDGPNTLIQWNGNSVNLLNTEHTDITADDFVF
ncbi:hypothetical protein [Planktotalea sp.]|uniref:hypothetical protein n=1 Tax=Planktotalea sp. TaxID=2029877 RepID=UPI003D6A0081